MDHQTQFAGASEGATRPIRILVVDDSALMRKLISEILSAQPDMEVIGTAFDGADALSKTLQWTPDVVSLDIEMPRCNGLEYLDKMMEQCPTRTLVVSSLTREGAETTLQCLERGAIECLAKPAGSISLNITEIGEELTARIRIVASARLRVKKSAPSSIKIPSDKPLMTQFGSPHSALHAPSVSSPILHTPQAMDSKTILVAIASSTGGPAALHELLPLLPADLNAAYVLVQHLPPGFAHSLAERLNNASHLTVREAMEGTPIERGLVLVAPGGKHLEVDAASQIQFNSDPSLWGVRPAADIMMRSLSTQFGSRVLGVVLTGMGRDGAIGAKAIQQAGGTCFAQDEASCIVYGMPRAAVQAGAVARSISLQEMAAAVARQIITMQAQESRRAA
ncbi:chemotaxis response regulator protein-glutamate methylesterase [Nostoc sp. CHAB 5824]|nr:chemotaxis response regulator protein-glutamate methylesterase [Nostoc sp. CHAB 5824]